MMRAREGASMKCTNLVSSKVCRHVWVFLDGSVRASNRMGVMAMRGATIQLFKKTAGFQKYTLSDKKMKRKKAFYGRILLVKRLN